MQSPVIIAHSESDGTAQAADPVIMHFKKNPIDVTIVADQPAKKTFSWRVKVKDPGGQYATMNYRATVLNGKQFVFSATPLGYENTYRGDGSCTVKVQR